MKMVNEVLDDTNGSLMGVYAFNGLYTIHRMKNENELQCR